LVVLGVVVVLALFLIRPGAERLRSRIAGSISSAVGRQVDIGSVSVHLLPQPGFDLGNFVVHDDPAFSAEPMLRSDDVSATLRVSSLLRGRLEIASLNLTEPSVNLVRNSSGHWNLENLLERAAKTPVAPTSKATNETRPAFPYIEADRGRINFKFGAEKKAYALTDADFSFWQESENAWGMRMKAQPVRTDFNLSDTGTLRVNGTWQRAATMRQTPLQFTMQWDRAQLGQLTKLISGNDRGWRGSVTWSATLAGTPGDLGVHTEASVEDFRRYDILGGGSLRLAARCDGRYHSADRLVSDILCQAPVGEGSLTMNGSLNATTGASDYHLALTAQDIPAQSLSAFLRHAKQNVPDDLTAAGQLNGVVRIEGGRGGFSWSGDGQAIGLHMESPSANTRVTLDSIPFSFASGSSQEAGIGYSRGRKKIAQAGPPGSRIDIGPFELALGKTSPALVQGWVARSGYDLRITGETQVHRLLQVAGMVGLPAPHPAADGSARVDLQVAGSWSGFAAPIVMGKAQLQDVRAEIRGMNAPLEISSANLSLTANEVTVQNLVAAAGSTSWHGSLNIPRPCGLPSLCFIHFDLHTEQLTTDQLNQLLNPHTLKRPWYRFLTADSRAGPSYFLKVHAAGRVTADRMSIRNLVAAKVSAEVLLENGKLTASEVRGDVLGGKHVGSWIADFMAKPPAYSGSGKLEHIALGQLSDAMHDGWITGTATASYQAKAAGLSTSELFSSADASLQVEAHDGTLPHIELGEQSGPLRMRHLGAKLILHNSVFEISDGKLETPGGIYLLSGTASLRRTLDLKLARSGAQGFNITGTLTRPHVAPTATQETAIALKP
jgi:hypothetical protein